MELDELQLRFRDAMARVPAPVTVVTACVDGQPHGTTVSAFASLSLSPPMVIFALDNRGTMRHRIAEAGHVGVNILSGGQAELAKRFAAPRDRFEGVAWELDGGVPRLDGVSAFVLCDEVECLPGGDHTVVLGRVASAESYTEQALSYHLRAFHAVPPKA